MINEARSEEFILTIILLTTTELSNDTIIRNHLSALYDTLLEQNLLRIIEPYSRVEMTHIAKLVRQPVREVETKWVLNECADFYIETDYSSHLTD